MLSLSTGCRQRPLSLFRKKCYLLSLSRCTYIVQCSVLLLPGGTVVMHTVVEYSISIHTNTILRTQYGSSCRTVSDRTMTWVSPVRVLRDSDSVQSRQSALKPIQSSPAGCYLMQKLVWNNQSSKVFLLSGRLKNFNLKNNKIIFNEGGNGSLLH